ncbi:hypothetical protein OIE68_00665 [Nocardia vinacea]|nr:hypothetical protein OIE68_00665 [Nocardia vinacea]
MPANTTTPPQHRIGALTVADAQAPDAVRKQTLAILTKLLAGLRLP